MKHVITGMDQPVAEWVAAKIPHMSLGESPYTAIGLIDEHGYLHAGVIYSVYTGNDIFAHIALLNRRSINRAFIEAAFKYPFLQLNCARVTVMVALGNDASHEFVTRLGFQREGRLREWYEDGQDGIVYGMLRRECRWIHPRKHYGQLTTPANGTGRRRASGRRRPAVGQLLQ